MTYQHTSENAFADLLAFIVAIQFCLNPEQVEDLLSLPFVSRELAKKYLDLDLQESWQLVRFNHTLESLRLSKTMLQHYLKLLHSTSLNQSLKANEE
jgi:hypothetical protein